MSTQYLPSYPGTGSPAENLGGFRECPSPTQFAVIAWPVSVCHQWFNTGTCFSHIKLLVFAIT